MATLQYKLDRLASFEALLGCMKSLPATVGAVMAVVAAIRNTVFEDPEDIAVYRANLRLAVATAEPMTEEALNSYDDLLQDIINSQRYTNSSVA
jgi:hypothetical protein